MSLKYKKGELIIITHGEYDDYEIKNICKALVDFDAQEILKVWIEEQGRYAVNFDAWLILNKFIERVDGRELYIGVDYENRLTGCYY